MSTFAAMKSLNMQTASVNQMITATSGRKMIKLLYGNCFDLLEQIENNSVDLVITDPPYEHVMGGMKCKWLNNGTWSGKSYMTQKMSQFGYAEVIRFLDMVKPKMKKVNMYVFCSKLQLSHYLEWVKREKLKYDLLIWNKGLRGLKSTKFYAQDIEYIVRIYQDGVSLRKVPGPDGKSKVNYYCKCQSYPQPRGSHESMKPLKLIEQYIELSSDIGGVVLDPFMGSGTTGVACQNLERHFIGMEKEKDFYDLARERIEQKQMSIFDYKGGSN